MSRLSVIQMLQNLAHPLSQDDTSPACPSIQHHPSFSLIRWQRRSLFHAYVKGVPVFPPPDLTPWSGFTLSTHRSQRTTRLGFISDWVARQLSEDCTMLLHHSTHLFRAELLPRNSTTSKHLEAEKQAPRCVPYTPVAFLRFCPQQKRLPSNSSCLPFSDLRTISSLAKWNSWPSAHVSRPTRHRQPGWSLLLPDQLLPVCSSTWLLICLPGYLCCQGWLVNSCSLKSLGASP